VASMQPIRSAHYQKETQLYSDLIQTVMWL
jgi:hypothetical protein